VFAGSQEEVLMSTRPPQNETANAVNEQQVGRVPGEDWRARIGPQAGKRPKPQTSKLQERFKEAPPHTAEKLRQAAEGVRRQDRAFTRRMRFGGVATSAAAQTAAASWLPANRFDWWTFWDNQKTRTTVVQLVPGHLTGQDPAAALATEFSTTLVTVTGSRLDLLNPPSPDASTLAWDTGSVQDGDSPNSVPAIGFVARGALPQSQTLLETIPVKLGSDAGTTNVRVILNSQGAPRADNPQWVSLFIDFVVSQRAVALEYGFVDPGDRQMDPANVELIAYNEAGDTVAASFGTDLHQSQDPTKPPPLLESRRVYVIGLRGVAPANPLTVINRVELRFTLPAVPSGPPQLYHFVQRVWSEPLPPAAVMQDMCGWEYYPDRSKPRPDFGVPPLPDDKQGQIKLNLPYRCNRAAVFVRGFKLAFLDKVAREIAGISAGVTDQVFEVERGGQIMFWPLGGFRVDLPGVNGIGEIDPKVPYQVRVYYTVLAWDSDQMELTAVPSHGLDETGDAINQDSPQELRVELPDPCRSALLGVDPTQSCGPLFGGMSLFGYTAFQGPWVPYNQPLDEFYVAAGLVGGTGCYIESENNPNSAAFPHLYFFLPRLERANGSIDWTFCSLFSAGGEPTQRYYRRFEGSILTGRSLAIPVAFGGGAVIDEIGTRDPPPNDFQGPPAEMPLDGDMAFLGLGFFYARPLGIVRELEIEVIGKDFNGSLITFDVAAGVGKEKDQTSLAAGNPVFGTLSRKPLDASVSTQDLLFNQGVVGLFQQVPDQYGVLRNDGNGPLNVTDVTFGGANFEEFMYWINYRDHVFFNFANTGFGHTAQLAPSEALVITGWFAPQAASAPDAPPRTAFLDFQTSSPQNPVVRIQLLGHTRASQANGFFMSDPVDFSAVHVGQSTRRSAAIGNNGHTPLFVSLRIENQSLGYQILSTGGAVALTLGGVNGFQVNPGGAALINLAFTPGQAGIARTRLLADTNSADPSNRQLSTTLIGQGVPAGQPFDV
jgi:hypothetical protein